VGAFLFVKVSVAAHSALFFMVVIEDVRYFTPVV
jgi:hypothetical protein